jgi:hypothetical protein
LSECQAPLSPGLGRAPSRRSSETLPLPWTRVNRSKNGLPQKSLVAGKEIRRDLNVFGEHPSDWGRRCARISAQGRGSLSPGREPSQRLDDHAASHDLMRQLTAGVPQEQPEASETPEQEPEREKRAPGPLRERLGRAQGPGPGGDASSEVSPGHHSSS